MDLIIGGYAQGKFAYAKSKYADAEHIDEKNFRAITSSDKPVIIINHLHLIAKELCKEVEDSEKLLALVREWGEKTECLVVISDEIGNGIVPMDKEQRIWREALGRVLVELAKNANNVERIVCQLPQKLK